MADHVDNNTQLNGKVYTDNFVSYDVLVVSNVKHYRINHSTQFFDKKDRPNHIMALRIFGTR